MAIAVLGVVSISPTDRMECDLMGSINQVEIYCIGRGGYTELGYKHSGCKYLVEGMWSCNYLIMYA